ncbi:MAG: DNA recombination protein RmuC [Alphaproteobacteria bacterium]
MQDFIYPLLSFAGGALLCFLVQSRILGIYKTRLQTQESDIGRLTAEKQLVEEQMHSINGEVQELRQQKAVLETLVEQENKASIGQTQRYEQQLQQLQQEKQSLEQQINQNIQENARLREQKAVLEADLAQEKRTGDEKLQLLEQARQQLSEHFQSLSLQALQQAQDQFFNLARLSFEKNQEQSKQDMDKRQAEFAAVVQPLASNLQRMELQVQELEKNRQGAYKDVENWLQTMKTGHEQLSRETSRLSAALHHPASRGQWGEMHLKKVVEQSGMVNYCNFDEQTGIASDDRRSRPDMIIHLPGGHSIAVDAKVPMDSFWDAIDGELEVGKRQESLQRFAKAVRVHVKALAEKSYWQQLESSPEFVVLFLPTEAMFRAALEGDPSLLEMSFGERVVLATPITLIALLKTASYGWNQEKIAKNAMDIKKAGEQLYNAMGTFSEHMNRLGRNLEQAVKGYNDSVGSLEGNILPKARKFKDLGVGEEKSEIGILEPRQLLPRPLTAREILTNRVEISDDGLIDDDKNG